MANTTQATIAQLQALNPATLTTALQEYLNHIEENGWEGYKASEAAGARVFLRDLLLTAQNI